tara:strand:- start:8408 stop:9160 length:753 start_codon:yes stop_codon:yes gene_type:complete
MINIIEKKKRLDVWLEENNFFTSRNIANSIIKNGLVKVNGKIITKSGYKVGLTDNIALINESIIYVSRSALKLRYLIDRMSIDINGLSCLDIGASTGGFSQVLIEYGAKKVYAVDVGKDQLSDTLINDDRINNMEKTDCRYLDDKIIADADLVSVDVSFISLKKAVYHVLNKSRSGTIFCILFKPQFELDKRNISKNGLVKDTKLVWEKIIDFEKWLICIDVCSIRIFKSPILGKNGNQEWLVYAVKHNN